ncbi:hypothetical protein L1871_22725 (plasmid) [Aeromonas caviae]|uniref:Phage tail assembly protein n=1 Tax=Aeromonas caviae TaxID=648 RepID=A0A6M4NTU9_AERCA|nr:hypothetical protein [Aeromonas caviae]QJR99818.1 Hypothetical protein [Aeromonas caviae]QMV81601.1 Hypothetical protein [Aeromonas caviae]UJQ39186.1 hypothetical protein L1871_22725 [Aeromonas caviae]
MKLLNLDDLFPNQRFVRIKGVEYPIVEQSLGSLIQALKQERDIDRNDQVAVFESMLVSAGTLIPEAPAEVLRTLSIRQLTAVVQFASASDEHLPDAKTSESAEEGK